MTDLTADECTELWKKFEDKVKNDWSEKYKETARHEFRGLANIQTQKTKVVKKIWDDIEKVFKTKNLSTDIIPTELYFYSLTKTGINTGSHSETIETLVYYLGYDSIKSFTDEFRNKKSTEVIKTQENEIIPHTPEKSLKNNKELGKWLIYLLISIALLITIFLSYYWYNNKYFSTLEKDYFKQIIESAGDKEMKLYASSDTSRLKELDSLFTKKGQARATILGEIDKTLRKNRKLRILQSHRRIIEWNFIKKTKEEIHIQTKEKWKLVWYNPITDEDVSKYDTTNTQLYILIKENNRWKIDLNDYNGKKQILKK